MWSPRSKSASTVDVVTVLLLPRIQEHPVIIVSSSRKRKLPSRPPPRRVDRHMIEAARADGSKIYSEKQFYNGLLVAMFKGSGVSHDSHDQSKMMKGQTTARSPDVMKGLWVAA